MKKRQPLHIILIKRRLLNRPYILKQLQVEHFVEHNYRRPKQLVVANSPEQYRVSGVCSKQL